MPAKRTKTEYNIRVIDNGDGTYSLGFVSRLKACGLPKDTCGMWVPGSRNKMIRLLTKGTLMSQTT